MSINTRTDQQYQDQAEQIREASDILTDVARQNETIEPFLMDVVHAVEDGASIIEEEGGDLTTSEFAERVYPSGGRR